MPILYFPVTRLSYHRQIATFLTNRDFFDYCALLLLTCILISFLLITICGSSVWNNHQTTCWENFYYEATECCKDRPTQMKAYDIYLEYSRELEITDGHWKWYHLIDCIRVPIRLLPLMDCWKCELRSDKNSYRRPCSVDRTVRDSPANVCL